MIEGMYRVAETAESHSAVDPREDDQGLPTTRPGAYRRRFLHWDAPRERSSVTAAMRHERARATSGMCDVQPADLHRIRVAAVGVNRGGVTHPCHTVRMPP